MIEDIANGLIAFSIGCAITAIICFVIYTICKYIKKKSLKADCYIEFEPNLKAKDRKGRGDCAVRAFSKMFNISWKRAYKLLSREALKRQCITSTGWMLYEVIGENGFSPVEYKKPWYKIKYTFRDFAKNHKTGRYFLFSSGHMVTMIDGIIYDSWNSSNEELEGAFIDNGNKMWKKQFRYRELDCY